MSTVTLNIQQKYQEERAKRLRADGSTQYINLHKSDKFKHYQDDPWLDPNGPQLGLIASADRLECRFLILGAGFGGLLFAVRLLEAGIPAVDIRLVDSAGGFGGTWYWNRYPGLMCDVESYIYLPLLEEMDYMPKHTYSYGPELREYCNSIAVKYGLQNNTFFRAEISRLVWNAERDKWDIKMTQKQGLKKMDIDIRSQFVISASGLLHFPQIPDLPGIDGFRGHSFHTSRWDYSYTGGSPEDSSLKNIQDKKVAIIGTGATAVQVIPHLAKWAKELYVFQRTPSAVDQRGQGLTDADWWASETKEKGWQRKRQDKFNACLSNARPQPAADTAGDGWSQMPSYSAVVCGPSEVTRESARDHVANLHALDFPRSERVRARVDDLVENKATAESLKAWYPGWCKRPCFHDDYLPSFNLQHVDLIDTDGNGVDGITEAGPVYAGKEYPVDLVIFSTGYIAPGGGGPAYRASMTVTGRAGKSLEQKSADGMTTLHGIVSRDFPNLFYPGPAQAGVTANTTFVLDQLSLHIAYILAECTKNVSADQQITIEPTEAAEQAWTAEVIKRAPAFAGMAGCTPGYLNNEGLTDKASSPEERMNRAKGAPWGDGIADYVDRIEAWRVEGGLKGLEIKVFGPDV